MKKILITGAKGFIGCYLIEQLKNSNPNFEYFESKCDLTDPIKIKEELRVIKPNVVLHMAALCGAKNSQDNPGLFFTNNFLATKYLIDEMINLDIKKLIFTSSMTVFGESDVSINEKAIFYPKHQYSLTKVLCENYIKFQEYNAGLTNIILRPTLVVGKFSKELHAIGLFIKEIIDNGHIQIFGDGSHIRDFIHPKDVAEFLKILINELLISSKYINKSFNLSNNEPISMVDLANKIFLKKKKSPKLIYIPKNSQTFSLFCDNTNSSKLFKPKYNLDFIIDEMINCL